jgi:nucleoside-diphosphate-sugar epimerase
MKIAITGHTRGIGFGLTEAFRDAGHTIVGYSRFTGHDLSLRGMPENIANDVATTGCDMLIINAHAGFSQVDLLYAIGALWANDTTKTVVTIGSRSSDGIKTFPHRYAVEKAALDKAVEQFQQDRAWRLVHIRPCWVDTPRVSGFPDARKLPVSAVVRSVLWSLDQPDDVVIRTIALMPR